MPLYRMIQEGLSNVGQHVARIGRGATDGRSGGGVVVSVHDDGCGFDPVKLGPVDQAGHFGLRETGERILDLGGTLDIHSAVGQGTELVITLPMVTREVNHAWSNGADHAADQAPDRR